MRKLLYLSICLLLCSCAGSNFLKQKYTSYGHDRHPERPSALAAKEKNDSSPCSMPKAPDENTGEMAAAKRMIGAQKQPVATAFSAIHSTIVKPLVNANKQDAEEEEEEKMSYGTWFLMILLLIPGCLIAGITLLFSEFWIGLLLIGLAVLFFFVWLNAEPELKWFK
ncbi:MAG: hypothetical protein K0S33_2570 [Bacteroidetes bacterium]|jgi:hypothetical protein|nr:hypothetical protein [Bacteroidota bacterium]